MTDKWNQKVEQVEVESWLRSWRQTIFTDLGSTFSLEAHIEKVTVFPDGSVFKESQPTITVSAASLTTPEDVADAIALQTAMTNILARRLTPVVPPAEPPVDPPAEPPVEP